MKTLEELREMMGVGGGAIAGTKEAGDDPPVRKKDQAKLIRRNKFMQNVYNRILRPKFRTERFNSIVGADEIGDAIREYARNNPGKGILVQCENTGAMTWLRLPRAKRTK
jgi:hypothetical protein